MASFSIEPLNFVHVAYLDYCLAKQLPYKDSIRDMLLYLKSTHFKIYTCYINNYIDVYQNIGHAKYTSINARGMCKVCLNQLDSINLTDKDYQILLDTLVNEILGSNIYSKSTPKEWNNYIKFIKKNKPYDLIIDGLNTHFTIHNINNAVQIIANKFASKGKKVLILGRKHMNMFLKYQSEKVDVILVDNYTDDDLYALYAALSSGRQAGLVTLDLMRSHIYNIKDHAKKDLFMKWFVAHQYTPYKIAGKIIVKPPKRISTSIQQQGNYWHVPVYDTNKISGLCMFPHTWVCMKL
ncbi:hypothetical protein KM043_018471 [Ampulex compressa]|nr:hypothetical protein KM043_018471 [Ampulex compressa]